MGTDLTWNDRVYLPSFLAERMTWQLFLNCKLLTMSEILKSSA